jgi:adenylate cyclase
LAEPGGSAQPGGARPGARQAHFGLRTWASSRSRTSRATDSCPIVSRHWDWGGEAPLASAGEAVTGGTAVPEHDRQEYFADGIVEEITTAISRLPWLFVIARNSSFAYKGKSPDLRQVGRELGVRYVLEGSVRKAGNRVRITGQLIDSGTGAHIWADRFEGTLDDIFELQDQVTSSVVGAIEPKLRQSEIDRAVRKPTQSLDAYDLYLRALAHLYKLTAEGVSEAIALLGRALEIDPSYAPAAGFAAWCRVWQQIMGWGPLADADVAEAVRLAKQAIETGKDDPDALWTAGITVAVFAGEVATAASLIERALTLNPNSAPAWMASGYVGCFLARPDNAAEGFQRAIRLSPLDPFGYLFTGGLACAQLFAGHHEEAMEWVDRSHCVNRTVFPVSVTKSPCAGCYGRADEGRRWLDRLARITPRIYDSCLQYRNGALSASTQLRNIMSDGLRKAGLPEG